MRTVTGVCELCGTGFTKPGRGKPYRFCSRECGVRGRLGATRRAKVTLECVACKRPYEVQHKQILLSRYCSRKCKDKHQKKVIVGTANPNYRHGGIRTCEACGKTYISRDKHRRYCGAMCSWPSAASEGMANQRRGYETELKCMDRLENDGYMAFRSARSRGPFDVFALAKGGILLVQVKRTKIPGRKRHASELEKLRKVDLPLQCVKQLWCWVDRQGWFFIHMYPDGSTDEWWEKDGAYDRYIDHLTPIGPFEAQYALAIEQRLE